MENSEKNNKSTSLSITNILLGILVFMLGFGLFYVKTTMDQMTKSKQDGKVPVVEIQEPNREVIVCSSYTIGADASLDCQGGYKGRATMGKLYKDGWRYSGSVGGGYKFILIFEK
jgi:hypothetical protein